MKIKKSEMKSFLNNLHCYKGVLLYGQDLGKIDMLSKAIIKKLNSLTKNNISINRLEYNNILQDPSLLKLELYSADFFTANDYKIVIVHGALDFASKQLLKTLNELELVNSYIIFLANNLNVKSTLRIFYEKSSKFASIPCYIDSVLELEKLLLVLLKKYNLQCSDDAKKKIISSINGDRLFMESEIKKLSMYVAMNNNVVNINTVRECCIAYSQDNLSDLCIKFVNKDINFFNLLNDLLYKGVKIITIVSCLQNYFSQMLKIYCFMELDNSFDTAISMINPPIFFYLANAMKKQLNFWNIDSINKIIRILLSIEIDCKIFCKIDVEILLFFSYRVFNNNLDLSLYT